MLENQKDGRLQFANRAPASQQSPSEEPKEPDTGATTMLSMWAYETRREELSMSEWLESGAGSDSNGSG
jgi:hypothetical protein